MNDLIASSPFFNLKPHRLSDQLLNEMLAQLLVENQQVINDHSQNNTFTRHYKSEDYLNVFLFFHDTFELTEETTFLAIELFERFLFLYLEKSARFDDSNSDQAILKILNCFQIANKLNSNHNCLTIEYVQRCLQTMNVECSLDAILDSEMTILKTLDYNVNIVTPFYVVELLLEILARRIDHFNAKQLHLICRSILFTFYHSRRAIYDQLFEKVKHQAIDMNVSSIYELEKNSIYLAASTIAGSVVILEQSNESLYHRVREELELMTNLNQNCIQEFAFILIEQALDDN